MSSYSMHVGIIGRQFKGRLQKTKPLGSVVAAAAYRSGTVLTDRTTGETYDFRSKRNVKRAYIILPSHAQPWMAEREELWNSVQQFEKRRDSQFAREFRFSLPRRLSWEARYRIVEAWARTELVARGMIADIAFHCPVADDGLEHPHTHILTTLRSIKSEAEGGAWGNKARQWNERRLLGYWRKSLEIAINEELMEADVEERVFCSSYASRGLYQLYRQPKLGPRANHERRRTKQPRAIGNEKKDKKKITVFSGIDSHVGAMDMAEQLNSIDEIIEADPGQMQIEVGVTEDEKPERLVRWETWRHNAAKTLTQSPELAVAALTIEGRYRFSDRELCDKIRSLTGGLITEERMAVMISDMIKSRIVIPFQNHSVSTDRIFTTSTALEWELGVLDAAATMWSARNQVERLPFDVSKLSLNKLTTEIDQNGRLTVIAGNDLPIDLKTLFMNLSKRGRAHGFQVIGACPTTSRAKEMQEKYDFPCCSLPILVTSLEQKRTKLSMQSLVVVEDGDRLTLSELKTLLVAINQLGARILLTAQTSPGDRQVVSGFNLLKRLCPLGRDLSIRWTETIPPLRAAIQLARVNRVSECSALLAKISTPGVSEKSPSIHTFNDLVSDVTRSASIEHAKTYNAGFPAHSLHNATGIALVTLADHRKKVLSALRKIEAIRINQIRRAVKFLLRWVDERLAQVAGGIEENVEVSLRSETVIGMKKSPPNASTMNLLGRGDKKIISANSDDGHPSVPKPPRPT